MELADSDIIATLDNISFRTPRGKFVLDFFPDQLRFQGEKFSTRIKYEAVKKCFVLHQPNDKVAIVV